MQSIIDQHINIIKSFNETNDYAKELEYYSSIGTIIDDYYDAESKEKPKNNNLFDILDYVDDISDTEINNDTKIEDAYWVEVNDDKNKSKEELINNFNNIVNNKPLCNHYDYDKCLRCGNEMNVDTNDGLIVCDKCGNVERILVESDIPSYKDSGSDKPIYPYKRLNHFMECINQFQAKENISIPQSVYDQIYEVFKKKRIRNLKRVKLSEIRDILKSFKLNKYYEHVSFIYSRITGNPPPRLTYEQENELINLFKKIDKSFYNFCPKDRSNFFNYNYLLHKLFKNMNMPQYLEYFPLLKSKEKLIKQEEIWKMVCNDIGIPYQSD